MSLLSPLLQERGPAEPSSVAMGRSLSQEGAGGVRVESDCTGTPVRDGLFLIYKSGKVSQLFVTS